MAKTVLFDVNEAEWKVWEEGVRSAVFKPCKSVTMQYWEISHGTGAKPHSHECEQLVYIQQGVVDFTVGGVTYNMTPGCFCLVPSGVEHSSITRSTTTAVNIDIFLPERDDREQSPKKVDLGHNW